MKSPIDVWNPASRVGAESSGAPHVEFLDASSSHDHNAWIELWESWPDREVMAHPDFVRLFARPGDRVVGAAARTNEGGILYPVIVRPFSEEPWGAPGMAGCDLTTAYAYGGPFAWNFAESDAAAFWIRFDAWAREIGAATSFARLSLFPEIMIPFNGPTLDRGPNVIRRLDVSDEELWSSYEGKVRRNVQRARRENVTVVPDFLGQRLDDFLRVYDSTMDRREAKSHYYFPRGLFESLISELPGRFVFMHALVGGKVVSSDLMLLSERNAYYWLGGSLAESFALRPNDLLKHETFLLCRSLGKKRVILGGGYLPDDGLLKYKRSFAPGSEAPFRTGARTYDPDLSNRLVERRRAWEIAQGRAWSPAEGYFPPYRS